LTLPRSSLTTTTHAATYRIYTQTNPLHFASEWKLLSANKQEYELALEKYKKSGASIKDKEKAKKQAKGKKAKALALKAEMGAARDRDIALALETRLPELEDFETVRFLLWRFPARHRRRQLTVRAHTCRRW
jgi:hypothetical protein